MCITIHIGLDGLYIYIDLYSFRYGLYMFYTLFDVLILSCLSLRILRAPWAQDPGPQLDWRPVGRIDGRSVGRSDGRSDG